MNLIINPSGQFLRVPGVTSFHPDDGAMTLSRWRALMDANGRFDVAQNTGPFGMTLTWNSTGWGCLSQTIEREEFEQYIGAEKTFAFDASQSGGPATVYVDILAWSGTVNKPTIDPVATWGASLSLASGWTLVASQSFSVTGTNTRFATDPVTIPNASNIAVLIRGQGAYGNQLSLSKVSFADTPAYPGYDYVTEWKRNEWFYQYLGVQDLYGVDWGFGNTAYSGFNFPLNNPLRGRVGAAGVQDVTVSWAGAWYAYGGGTNRLFQGAPNLSCHHRSMMYFGVTFTAGVIPGSHAFVYRGFGQPVVTFDAELRP